MENTNKVNSQQKRNVDIFVDRFFVGGARNYIRKTTWDQPWLNVGIMEKTNPDLFYTSQLFRDMNIFGGAGYSLGHGMIHGYLEDKGRQHVTRAIANLNALPAREIIFYHDECLCGLETAREMGLELSFTPVPLLEWLVRTIQDEQQIRSLTIKAAVQLPCSSRFGVDRNTQLDTLLNLIGVQRVTRRYDYDTRLCCGARGYFGLFSGNIRKDADYSESLAGKNIDDAKTAGASHIVTLCPYCYAAIAPTAREAGLAPISIEGLASLALYRQESPTGLIFR